MNEGALQVGNVVIPAPAQWVTSARPVSPAWKMAAQEKPDADIAVLGVNAHHDAYWIAAWDGESWYSVDTMQVVRVTHWMDLPEPPEMHGTKP